MTLVNSRTVRGRCPTCGAQHAVCGTASDSVPVDSRMEVAVVGGPLKRYTVTTPSGVVTTMKLNEADAERLGALEEGRAEARQVVNTEAPAKARTTRNKARSVTGKDGGTGGDG